MNSHLHLYSLFKAFGKLRSCVCWAHGNIGSEAGCDLATKLSDPYPYWPFHHTSKHTYGCMWIACRGSLTKGYNSRIAQQKKIKNLQDLSHAYSKMINHASAAQQHRRKTLSLQGSALDPGYAAGPSHRCSHSSLPRGTSVQGEA